jgi:OOP family OmpA-OmpF porin
MRCNWWRWLWGIVPLLVLGWVAVQAEQGRLEKDLTQRSASLLAERGYNWAMAEFKGRDAVLTGRAPVEGEPAKAADALAEMFGVRTVVSKATLLDKADKYTWTASRHDNRIRLRGFAPSINARQAILGVAKASFPGFEVVDRTTLARGAPSTDVWLAGVSFVLKQLTSLRSGHGRLDDLELHITGEAEDIAGYRAVKQALATGLPKGIKLQGADVTAPVVSPYVWSAQMGDGRLVLAGYVQTDAQRAELVDAAKAGLPNAQIIDEMEPGEGAPPGWVGALSAALRELGRLEGGSLGMKDATIALSGTAESPAAAEAIRASLRAALPPAIKFNDLIRAKEPPPPPPPPPPEPAQATAPAPEASATSPPLAPEASSFPPPKPAEDAVASRSEAAPPPPPEAVVKAKACEEQMAGLVAKGQILFDRASAELDSVSFPTLDRLADAAKSCPGMTIEVAGHASSDGDAEHNKQLSLKRAQSVVTYLVRAGVDAGQLQSVGYGAERPVAPNDTNENMARNRRIEFTVRPN